MRGKSREGMIKVIAKKNIHDLVREAAKAWDVYAPQMNAGRDIWMQKLPHRKEGFEEALQNIVLDDCNILISPKDIFFPQCESMFEFRSGAMRQTLTPSGKFLLGVKACDLKGILFVDDFFKRNFEDVYYVSRAKDRVIAVIGCISPPRPDACFCTSAGTGPFLESGFDLQLIDAGQAYFVEIGSPQGEAFVRRFAAFFEDPHEDPAKQIARIKQKASESVGLKVDFKRSLERMSRDDFEPEENYRRIGQRCIYCGGCLYVCPTCTCFNVVDVMAGKQGFRFRNWDGCVFEGYTREASGHNPRKEKWLRTSRRYEHKLRYDYRATGTSGCVGCGRCLASCPVHIGMSQFIREITEDKKIM